ncbi:hypothetical protein Tco_1422371, partial [Tanacetum coccineum]
RKKVDVEYDEEIDVDDDDRMDDPEVIHPYEEDDPLKRPPPDSDSELEAVASPGSSAIAFTTDHYKVSTPGPLGKNMDALYSKVKTLTKQMKDRYDIEFRMPRKFDRSDLRMNSFDDGLS